VEVLAVAVGSGVITMCPVALLGAGGRQGVATVGVRLREA